MKKSIFLGAMILVLVFIFLSIGSLIFGTLIGLKSNEILPWTGYIYYSAYSDNDKVITYLLIGHAVSLVLSIALVLLIFKTKKRKVFGDAKWAKESDLKNATPKLRGKKGILIGIFLKKFLIQVGQQFVIIAAPTRSGKGVSLVIPNCLNWTESLVVTDIKLENFQVTSGFRHECGHDVYLFNPSPNDYKTHCWNPLSYINFKKDFRVNDIQTIAFFLCPTPKTGDPMWSSEARELFLGFVLYLLDSEKYPITIGEVLRQLRTELATTEYIDNILKENDYLDPICKRALSGFLNLPHKQGESVKSTLTSALNLWSSPILDAATSKNDFDFRDLRKKKMAIYIGINPNDLDKYAPVLNLFIQQMVSEIIKSIPGEDDPYQVLAILDEFAALGELTTIINSVSFLAGYNFRLMPIIQNTSQLKSIYGVDKTTNFLANHATRVLFAPKNIEDATEISNELGTTTVKNESISGEMGFSNKSRTKTMSYIKRHLLLPQEVKEIGAETEIVLSENCKPIMGEKISYYQNKEFLKRCVKPENLELVKKTKSQSDFLKLVKEPAPVPTINIIHYEMRGVKETKFELIYDSISYEDIDSIKEHNEDETLTDEQINEVADNFMATLGV